MKTLIIESSFIAGIGYDHARRQLFVGMKTGATYCYLNVPREVYAGLASAKSHGQYYNRYIKNNYEYHVMVQVEAN